MAADADTNANFPSHLHFLPREKECC